MGRKDALGDFRERQVKILVRGVREGSEEEVTGGFDHMEEGRKERAR